jgi:hypothetical protein
VPAEAEAEAEAEVEAPRSVPAEFVPYVTRRSGLVRSRYVVVTDDSGRTAERSKAFWLIGRAAAQQRRAEAAWDDLANHLRGDGWELDTAGRYEYYVPLRRAIISTLEPYSQAGFSRRSVNPLGMSRAARANGAVSSRLVRLRRALWTEDAIFLYAGLAAAIFLGISIGLWVG